LGLVDVNVSQVVHLTKRFDTLGEGFQTEVLAQLN
jgi:hypothetical protein